MEFVVLLLFTVGFIYLSVNGNSLTLPGAVGAAVIGWTVYFLVGWLWLIPLFFFLISSTVLGKLFSEREIESDAKMGKQRDIVQVFCNGFPYFLMALLYPTLQSVALFLMSVSMAIATADTWATEFGTHFSGKTIDIRNFKRCRTGLSGGISLIGSIGAFVGALAIASLCAWIMYHQFASTHSFDWSFNLNWLYPLPYICFFGFVGMLIDSLMGSLLQVKYIDPNTQKLYDKPAPDRQLYSGFVWMNNDLVNLLSNLIGLVLAGVWACYF